MSRKDDELSLTPLVSIKGNATAGVDPSIMGIGPVSAVKKALEKAAVSLEDVQLVEETKHSLHSQSLWIVNFNLIMIF